MLREICCDINVLSDTSDFESEDEVFFLVPAMFDIQVNGYNKISLDDELTVVYSTKGNYGIEPRSITCEHECVVISGTRMADKQSVIIKYKYNDMKLIPVQKKEINRKDGNITALAAGEKTFAFATSEGSIHILDQKSLKTIAKHNKVHGAPSTTLCECGDSYVTGSLDRFTISVSNKKQKSYAGLIFTLLLLTILLISVYFYVPGGKQYFELAGKQALILGDRIKDNIKQRLQQIQTNTNTPVPTPESVIDHSNNDIDSSQNDFTPPPTLSEENDEVPPESTGFDEEHHSEAVETENEQQTENDEQFKRQEENEETIKETEETREENTEGTIQEEQTQGENGEERQEDFSEQTETQTQTDEETEKILQESL